MGSKIEFCGIPQIISTHFLYEDPILVRWNVK